MANDENMSQGTAESVELRCAFCEQFVEVRNGVAGKVFICFGCVDAINQFRAQSEGSSVT